MPTTLFIKLRFQGYRYELGIQYLQEGSLEIALPVPITSPRFQLPNFMQHLVLAQNSL